MTLRSSKARQEQSSAEEAVSPVPFQSLHMKRRADAYDFGFIVLCPERNIGGLQNTVLSIRNNYPWSSILGIVGSDATSAEIKIMSTYCEMAQGDNTITSLINLGMKRSPSPWNILVFAGSWVRGGFYRKFDAFVKDERDILFPVVDGRTNFVDGSLNGLILNKKKFAEIGDFPTHEMHKEGHNDLELIKLWWAMDAMEKGCVFKAIIGMKVV